MTTIHSFTNDQVLVDVFHKDMRRARSAVSSIIPTKTGAAKAIGLVLPELAGRLDGVSMRVPTMNVSFVDLCFTAGRETTVEEVNEIMKLPLRIRPITACSLTPKRSSCLTTTTTRTNPPRSTPRSPR